MTGFGRASCNSPSGTYVVEIQGLNRRFLEINISLPKSLLRFELALKKVIEERVGRGQVNVSIKWEPAEKNAPEVKVNFKLARSLFSAFLSLANEFSLEKPKLNNLLSEEGVLFFEDRIEEDILKDLKEAVDLALTSFMKTREEEGAFLAKDLQNRLVKLSILIDKIDAESKTVVEKFREKLEKRVAPYISKERVEDRELLMKEIVLFADRADISEEMVRFRGHLAGFEKALALKPKEASDTKGKRFDFLLQELHREINTLSNKAQGLEISQLAVEAKWELEKMREQVQNIE